MSLFFSMVGGILTKGEKTLMSARGIKKQREEKSQHAHCTHHTHTRPMKKLLIYQHQHQHQHQQLQPPQPFFNLTSRSSNSGCREGRNERWTESERSYLTQQQQQQQQQQRQQQPSSPLSSCRHRVEEEHPRDHPPLCLHEQQQQQLNRRKKKETQIEQQNNTKTSFGPPKWHMLPCLAFYHSHQFHFLFLFKCMYISNNHTSAFLCPPS